MSVTADWQERQRLVVHPRRGKRNFRTRFYFQLFTLPSGLGFPLLLMQRVPVRCSEKAFGTDKSIRQFSRGKREGAQTNDCRPDLCVRPGQRLVLSDRSVGNNSSFKRRVNLLMDEGLH